MNCREFEVDVVDLARGAGMSAAAAERLGEHLGQCAGCAARLARERALTTALQAVAADVSPSTRTDAIEAHLLAAFTERQAATGAGTARRSRSAVATPAAWGWLAAAAVLVLAVGVWQGAARWRSEPAATTASTPDAANPAAPAQTTAGAAVGMGEPGFAANAANTANAATPEIVTRAAPRREPAPLAPRTREGDVLRFVTLPTAIGLPPIESGRIVRVEMPAAMLPAYGLDVTPDSGAGTVEADVLVGQDGQPRAIRFVTLDSGPRRRQ